MAFMFNFPNPNINSSFEAPNLSNELNSKTERTKKAVETLNSSSLDNSYLNAVKNKYKVLDIGQYTIKYIPSLVVFEAKQSCNSSIVSHVSEENYSDLIPGVYEGGMKLWECSIDLTTFLHDHNCLKPGIKVLELGCGPGIPGILAYLKGCTVTFQDYNTEVLELSTIPNVFLNNTSDDESSKISQKCTFISGDWENLKYDYDESLKDEINKFDVILTSETIYDKRNHEKLLDLMKCALKPSGLIYLAAKTHYFGVGGTLDDFQQLVMEDKLLTWQICYSSNDGVKRHIVKLSFKNNKHIK